MMLVRMAIAAGVGLPGLSNTSRCIDDSFPNIAFSISAVLGSFQVQKQKYWNLLSKVIWLRVLLVLVRALPSGDLQGRSLLLQRRAKGNFPYCLCVSDHPGNELFSGAEVAFRFVLERADSLFHLAVVPRAMADPKRTVLKGLAPY